MQTTIETETEREIVQFLTRQPSPDAIIAFHPSSAATERLYELVDAQRERTLTDDERRELDVCLYNDDWRIQERIGLIAQGRYPGT